MAVRGPAVCRSNFRINITVAPDKQSAVADLTVEANVSGEHDSIVREMKFTLRKPTASG